MNIKEFENISLESFYIDDKDSLRKEANLIALEAFNLRAGVMRLSKFLPKVSKMLSASDDSLKNNYEDLIQVEREGVNPKKALKALDKFKYLEIAGDAEVIVPENFKGNIAEYLEVLNEVDDNLLKKLNFVMPTYQSALSLLVNNNDFDKFSASTCEYEDIQMFMDTELDKLNEYFPVINGESTAYLSDLLNNKEDCIDFITNKDKIGIDTKQLKHVAEQIDTASDKIDLIVKNIVSKDDAPNPSYIKLLSTITLDVANLLEAVSVVNFRVYTVLATKNNIIEIIAKHK